MGVLTDALDERKRVFRILWLVPVLTIPGFLAMFASAVFAPTATLFEDGPAAVWRAFGVALRTWPVSTTVFATGLGALLVSFVFIGTVMARSGAAPTLQFLWLRRFHTETPPRFPVSRLLEQLNFAGAHGWTLRDSRVRLSGKAIGAAFAWSAGANRLSMALALLFLICLALLTSAANLSAMGTTDFVGAFRPYALFGIGFIGIAAGAAMLTAGLAGMRDALRIETNADTLFERIVTHWAKLRPPASTQVGGITVIGTPDELWKQAVKLILERVDFVLIDVTDMSDNIAYELEAIREMNLSHRVILITLCEKDDWSLPPKAESVLRLHFGKEWLANMPAFSLPKYGKIERRQRVQLAAFIEGRLGLRST